MAGALLAGLAEHVARVGDWASALGARVQRERHGGGWALLGAVPGARPTASVFRAFTMAWALRCLAEVSGVTGVYLPSMAWPIMWATFSAMGASERAQRGIVSASSWVSGARSLTWPSRSLGELHLPECAPFEHVEHEAPPPRDGRAP